MIVELIAFSIFIVAFFTVLTHNYILVQKKKKLLAMIVQLEIDKTILYEKLAEAMLIKESKSDVEQTEGFLKFISESRDWAFKYIEDVQSAIKKFGTEISPEIDYITKYSSLMGISQVPSLNKISEAYQELLKLMPDDSDTKDQPQG
jgi:DNA mismatch repair ATPase MutL